MRRRFILLVAGLAAFGALAGAAFWFAGSAPRLTARQTAASERLQRVEIGMTLADVEEAVGSPPTTYSCTLYPADNGGKYSIESRGWGPDGDDFWVKFKHGRVIEKGFGHGDY